jgi:hypothetical protein
MCDIPGLIRSLQSHELEQLKQRGLDGELEAHLIDAIDRAAGGPGEGRGYYVVRGHLEPVELRTYYLREDVAAAVSEV